MAISIVNGFVCTSCCDVAKAKKGEDPHPNLHAADPTNGARKADGATGGLDGPAVLFGGSLAELARSQAVSGIDGSPQAGPAELWKQGFSVDVLA